MTHLLGVGARLGAILAILAFIFLAWWKIYELLSLAVQIVRFMW